MKDENKIFSKLLMLIVGSVITISVQKGCDYLFPVESTCTINSEEKKDELRVVQSLDRGVYAIEYQGVIPEKENWLGLTESENVWEYLLILANNTKINLHDVSFRVELPYEVETLVAGVKQTEEGGEIFVTDTNEEISLGKNSGLGFKDSHAIQFTLKEISKSSVITMPLYIETTSKVMTSKIKVEISSEIGGFHRTDRRTIEKEFMDCYPNCGIKREGQ